MGGTRRTVLWSGLVLAMVLLAAACVQPAADEAAVATAPPAPTTAGGVVIATPIPMTPTPPVAPVQGPTFPPDVIAQWLLANLGVTANGLTPFTQLQVGPDDIVGYTFQDSAGNSCVGFAQTTASTLQVWNGDYRCFAPGTPAIAAPLLFALTNNEFYVASYGYVDPALAPTANAVAVQFPDGSSVNANLSNGGFVVLRQGLDFPTQAIAIEPTGNTVTTIPVQ